MESRDLTAASFINSGSHAPRWAEPLCRILGLMMDGRCG